MTITDIVNDIYFKTKTNSASYLAADMLIHINRAYNRAVSLIMGSDGRWEWDDNNQTDLPIATASIVSGQQDYQISTLHLRIKRVELQDSTGQWRRLRTYDNTDHETLSITALATTTGTPMEYDLLGGSIFLWPVPNFSQVSSIKVYFERGPAEFTSAEVATGTKSPGFNSLYHALIPLWVSYDYCLVNLPNLVGGYMAEIQRLEAAMVADYGRRNADDRPRMTMERIIFQ